MNYEKALLYLDSFINYEKIGHEKKNMFKLERMRHIADIFGNPQDSFKSVHVAGTKGKGSTAAFISRILTEAGVRVGLYTSPHLQSPREKISVNSIMISRSDFARQISEIKKMFERRKLAFLPTFFEIFTIAAFNYFRNKKIDYGVIETGLGGRLDATNIVAPRVSVISPISRDHTEILGGSLRKIAAEKIAIIKKGTFAVSAPQENRVSDMIRKKCKSLGVPLAVAGKDIKITEVAHDSGKEVFDLRTEYGCYRNCRIRLLGRHQMVNAACAVGSAEMLKKEEARISKKDIRKGLEKTKNPGRCEPISRNPYVVLDGAQNRASARAIRETIRRNFNYEHLFLILGVSKKKDIKGIVDELVPVADIIILTKANLKRAEKPSLIRKSIKGKCVIMTNSVREALSKAKSLAETNDLILITGSFFVIGEAKEIGSRRGLAGCVGKAERQTG